MCAVSRRVGRIALHTLVALLLVSATALPGVTHSTVDTDGQTLGFADDHWRQFTAIATGDVDESADVSQSQTEQPWLSDDDSRPSSTDGVRAIRADEVHERGVTGTGVRVGVVGSTFDADHEAIAGQVADHYSLTKPPVRPRHERGHDTAVAEVVTQTAPDADLYLAEVGTSPTPESYADAVSWLVANDVDVVVDAGSYFSSTRGDTSRIAAVAENAAADGVVFVTSAGNYGDRHWSGVSDGADWVEFTPGSDVNPLANGETTSGRVSLRLSWNTSADYDLYLYRKTPTRDRVVAKSVTRQTANDSAGTERIDVVVPRGVYYAAVYAHDAPNASRLRLFSTTSPLTHTTTEGSMVAPATSDAVIAVGAIDTRTGHVRAYSSRGTAEGDVDLGAPDGVDTQVTGTFYGTSAAAPYVAGTVALVESHHGGLSPEEVERLLECTADGESRRLDAVEAIEAVSVERPEQFEETGNDGEP